MGERRQWENGASGRRVPVGERRLWEKGACGRDALVGERRQREKGASGRKAPVGERRQWEKGASVGVGVNICGRWRRQPTCQVDREVVKCGPWGGGTTQGAARFRAGRGVVGCGPSRGGGDHTNWL